MTRKMSFIYLLKELKRKYGHDELWLKPGIYCQGPLSVVLYHKSWITPKILKGDGTAIAYRDGLEDEWILCGDYSQPSFLSMTIRPGVYKIDDNLKNFYSMIV
ncbi:hypothetical protein JOE09_001707 [Pantoea coffeiphila]|nr:hypothetical protein [Pantoea coffeiphila]